MNYFSVIKKIIVCIYFDKKSYLYVFFIISLQDEPSDFGVPMKVTYVLNQNNSVTEELLSEMVGTMFNFV